MRSAALVLAMTFAPVANAGNVDTPCPPNGTRAVDATYRALLARGKALDGEINEFYARCAKVVTGSAADAKCGADKPAIDASWKAYDDDLAAYEAERRRVRDAGNTVEITKLSLKISSTRAKISAMTSQLRNVESDMREWETLAEDARLKVRADAFAALRDYFVDSQLARISGRYEAQAALSETQIANLNGEIAKLVLPKGVKLSRLKTIKLHYWDWYAETHGTRLALRLSEAKTNLGVLKALEEMFGTLDKVETANAWLAADAKYKPVLESSAATLKMFVQDPVSKLIINNWQLNFSLGYLFLAEHYAVQRMDELNKVGAESLKGLAALSDLYKKQIDERTALKRPPVTDSAACR